MGALDQPRGLKFSSPAASRAEAPSASAPPSVMGERTLTARTQCRLPFRLGHVETAACLPRLVCYDRGYYGCQPGRAGRAAKKPDTTE